MLVSHFLSELRERVQEPLAVPNQASSVILRRRAAPLDLASQVGQRWEGARTEDPIILLSGSPPPSHRTGQVEKLTLDLENSSKEGVESEPRKSPISDCPEIHAWS